jgi:hypothetical protein
MRTSVDFDGVAEGDEFQHFADGLLGELFDVVRMGTAADHDPFAEDLDGEIADAAVGAVGDPLV